MLRSALIFQGNLFQFQCRILRIKQRFSSWFVEGISRKDSRQKFPNYVAIFGLSFHCKIRFPNYKHQKCFLFAIKYEAQNCHISNIWISEFQFNWNLFIKTDSIKLYVCFWKFLKLFLTLFPNCPYGINNMVHMAD